MAKREPKTIVVRQGEDFRITYRRGDGYSLEFNSHYVGSFDTADGAENERNRLAFNQKSHTN